jgi:mono/diheme cytochrome c family protein
MWICSLNIKTAAVWVLAAGSTVLANAESNQVTFSKDVLPIFQENCQECHRASGLNLSGMVAPMSLTSFRETRPWAKAIAKVVANKSMPPWFASENDSGKFELERGLTDEEIDMIVRWSQTGAKQGNPNDAPASRGRECAAAWRGWRAGCRSN